MSWLDEWENATHATKAGVVAAQRLSLAIDDEDVAKFIADDPNESQSKRREWIVKKYRSYLANHRNGEEGKNAKGHYHAGFACACFAWREILGGFIAGDFIDELQTVYYESFDPALGDRIPPADEFAKIARDSLKAVLVELAFYNPDNPNDPDDPAIQKYLRNRANRNFGYRHDHPINTAPSLDDSAFSMNGEAPYDPWDWVETPCDLWDWVQAPEEIAAEIEEMMDWMASDAADSHSNGKGKSKGAKSESIFREYGPIEWAKPVESLGFVIPGVLCEDTFGANAGPKKSLKTHDNGALALSIATGISLYRHDVFFPVFKPGKGLYLIGEGGEKPVIRMLQRICRAYGIKLDEVMNDPAFPLILEFGAAPLDSDELRDEIKRLLDRHQPDFVLMESFYNFHPKEVNPANLYERGQVIDAYHKLVREGGENVISLLTDHYRSTNTGKSLDLDNISMAGQAENADSWITRYPEKTNVREGDFLLRVGFGSRQWGGTEWKINWHLGKFDHEKGCHLGEISWDAAPAYDSPVEESDNPDKIHFNNDDEVMAHIRSQVLKNPRMTKSEHIDLMYGEVQITKVRLRELWAKTREDGMIKQQKIERDEIDPKNPTQTRSVTREVWLPGQGAATAQEQRDTWGVTT